LNSNNLNLQNSIIISIKQNINKNFYCLIKFKNGSISMIKLAHGLYFNDIIYSYDFLFCNIKNKLLGINTWIGLLKKYFFIFNVLSLKYKMSKIASASGTYCQIININKEANFLEIKLPSNDVCFVNKFRTCFIGRNSNILKKYINFGKAGNTQKLGKRFTVRGVAKNPIDHPHGGRTKTNCPEVSPWGWVTKFSH